MNEVTARIKINTLRMAGAWRIFDEGSHRANMCHVRRTTITTAAPDSLDDNFEKIQHGVIDSLLLDESGAPFIVCVAKSSEIDPLRAKEQARNHALSQYTPLAFLLSRHSRTR